MHDNAAVRVKTSVVASTVNSFAVQRLESTCGVVRWQDSTSLCGLWGEILHYGVLSADVIVDSEDFKEGLNSAFNGRIYNGPCGQGDVEVWDGWWHRRQFEIPWILIIKLLFVYLDAFNLELGLSIYSTVPEATQSVL